MEAKLVYITTKDADEARRLGRSLLEKKLVACVNIIDPIESLYWWHDEIQQDTELVLIAKTRTERVDEVVASVKELHSYENPCIVVLPIEGGNSDFLKWIAESTET